MILVIKPTLHCNARCQYCDAHRTTDARMSGQDLRHLVAAIRRWAEQVKQGPLVILWHGGEPLLMGAPFWRAVAGELAGCPVEHRLQSNLTLLDDATLEAWRALPGVRVSTSIDPFSPELRPLAKGGDSLTPWLQAHDRLVAAGVRVSAVYVAHQGSRGRAGDLYRFFRNVGLSAVRINPLRPPGASAALSAREWGTFLLAMRAAWEADGRALEIAPIASWARRVETGTGPLTCEENGRCGASVLAVGPGLTLHPCGRLLGRQELGLSPGDTPTLRALLETAPMSALRQRVDDLRSGACARCPYFSLCHGGCPADEERDQLGRTPFCEGRRMVFEALTT